MPITLIDIIKPKNGQPFPIVEDVDLLGGFRVVRNTVARDAIGPKLKKHGMLVLDSSTKIVWSWNEEAIVWERALDLNPVAPPLPTPIGIFTAECPSTARAGDLVRPIPNWRTSVDRIDVHDFEKMPAIGCITSKIDPITAVVQTTGLVTGVYDDLMPGRQLFVGRDSRPSSSPPNPNTGEVLFHQPVGIAIDPGTVLLVPSIHLTRVKG